MKSKSKQKCREEIADPKTAIYHFKIYLLNISPMIYRRFKVKGDTHIAQLHHLIQIIMGWDNDHLHNFKIWGMEYGISRSGDMGFYDNPCKIFIGNLGFRVGDKKIYKNKPSRLAISYFRQGLSIVKSKVQSLRMFISLLNDIFTNADQGKLLYVQ